MLAEKADIIVRFQGGANAGHTIVNNYGKFALHTLPSGVFYDHTTSVIGNGVALNIPVFFKEYNEVVSRGVPAPKILISERAQMVMPEDFIMLPTVDFCFKELMQNDNIRKNIIAALLNVPPSEVENTELMPTILRKESKDDKYGILDVRVKLKDGEQIDFEMQVEAFDCWANRSVYYLSKMYAGEIKAR